MSVQQLKLIVQQAAIQEAALSEQGFRHQINGLEKVLRHVIDEGKMTVKSVEGREGERHEWG